jgi:hypothetical protein
MATENRGPLDGLYKSNHPHIQACLELDKVIRGAAIAEDDVSGLP